MKNLKNIVSQLEMVKTVILYLLNPIRVSITNSMAAFATNVADLQTRVAAIDGLFVQYADVLTGITRQKQMARVELSTQCLTAMRNVRAYALANNLQGLAASMHITESMLNGMTYSELIDRAGNAINAVTPLVPVLTNYNVTAATITSWRAKRDALAALLRAPREAVAARKAIGLQIEANMNAMMTEINTITDSLATNFVSNIQYYGGYKTSRRIISTGVHHTRLLATVVNDLNVPYINATVTVDEFTDGSGRRFNAVSGITDINGVATISEFQEGARTVTVSGVGIVSHTFGPFEFVRGRELTEGFTMQPEFGVLPAVVVTAPASSVDNNS